MKALKKALGLWGTYLTLIPFICMIIYLFIAVMATAPGAVANFAAGWVGGKLIIFVLSALIFAGIGIILGSMDSTD